MWTNDRQAVDQARDRILLNQCLLILRSSHIEQAYVRRITWARIRGLHR